MENVKMYTVDELGRVLIPKAVLAQVNWPNQTSLEATLAPQESSIILTPGDSGAITLDALNRVKLPENAILSQSATPYPKAVVAASFDQGQVVIQLVA